jgi:DNA polymerase II small subunit
LEWETLKADNTEEKRIIVNKLVNSGINITPSLLEFILNLDNPLEKINLIIKDSSFIANFKSHLTENILTKISNEEIKKVLKRRLFIQEPETGGDDFKIEDKPSQVHDNSNKVIYAEEINEVENSIFPESVDGVEISNESSMLEFDEKSPKLDAKKSKLNLTESTKSRFTFNPIAKEFDFQFEILKDPTGKLYTNGNYQDFFDLTLDKFNRLRNLMRKRTEVHNADNINNILRLSSKVEVSVIGLVNEIRKTKNANFFITLEDLTGLINIIIRKDSENQDNIKITERIINDQMVYIEGTYNPGDKGKPGIIYGNYITKIDIPRDFTTNKSEDPLAIALISDTHIGSKEFESKLWERFIDFLNGKVGNKHQRERAGKIKYIIINGDLVDGIGVYPAQKNDLLISDIYQQYTKATDLLSGIPEYIKIFYSSGNHEPVRNAIPRPAVPKKYSIELLNIGVECIGNPSLVQTHNVNSLIYHGDSILDLNMLVPGLEHEKSVETMREFLKCRHLAPIYGNKTQIAPVNKDWLVIDKIPDIFHTGHIHINDMGVYNNVILVNSGCFQSQTDFMNSLGIHPTPGIVSIIDLDTLKGTQLDLKNNTD